MKEEFHSIIEDIVDHTLKKSKASKMYTVKTMKMRLSTLRIEVHEVRSVLEGIGDRVARPTKDCRAPVVNT